MKSEPSRPNRLPEFTSECHCNEATSPQHVSTGGYFGQRTMPFPPLCFLVVALQDDRDLLGAPSPHTLRGMSLPSPTMHHPTFNPPQKEPGQRQGHPHLCSLGHNIQGEAPEHDHCSLSSVCLAFFLKTKESNISNKGFPQRLMFPLSFQDFVWALALSWQVGAVSVSIPLAAFSLFFFKLISLTFHVNIVCCTCPSFVPPRNPLCRPRQFHIYLL